MHQFYYMGGKTSCETVLLGSMGMKQLKKNIPSLLATMHIYVEISLNYKGVYPLIYTPF